MAYKELIKNFSKIRSYLKEFFIYGYNSRGNVGRKSDRSYDDEKRRIHSWLGDYVEESQGPDGKTTALSIDVRNAGFNPLYRAWKSASFTDRDITLHFILLDILNPLAVAEHAEGSPSGRSAGRYSLSEIISIIDTEYLSRFTKPLEFDESTIRKKLAEYEKQGLIEISRNGNKSVYSLRENIDLITRFQKNLRNALDFASEILPVGIIGSTLLDKMPDHENCFSFKHHYITQSMDSEIMLTLFEGMRKKCWVQIVTYNERKYKNENCVSLLPMKIISSSQTGRQYVVAHVMRQKKLKSFRLDNIMEAKLSDACTEYDAVKKRFSEVEKHLWGASFGNFRTLGIVEFTVKFREDEEHIYQRLVREKRCGIVERLSPVEARYHAEVWDVQEMFTWIRTFIMRITELHISDKVLEEDFWNDVKAMKELYD